MRVNLLLGLFLFLGFGIASVGHAQEAENEDTPRWYVSAYNIPWGRVDSLNTMIAKDQAFIEAAIAAGRILDAKVLIHDTATEWNVIIMNKFPSWNAIDAGNGITDAAREALSEEEFDARGEAYQYIFGDASAHRDWIYVESGD